MSTPNPTHIIAEAVIDVDCSTWTARRIAAHVVSKLTDAGYSIVPTPPSVGKCRDKYPLSDPALLCQRDVGHAGGHEALDASCDRFRWTNFTATEERTNG